MYTDLHIFINVHREALVNVIYLSARLNQCIHEVNVNINMQYCKSTNLNVSELTCHTTRAFIQVNSWLINLVTAAKHDQIREQRWLFPSLPACSTWENFNAFCPPMSLFLKSSGMNTAHCYHWEHYITLIKMHRSSITLQIIATKLFSYHWYSYEYTCTLNPSSVKLQEN